MPGKNDYVHYGAYGVCQVEDLRSIRFGPDTPRREYYVLRPVDQDGACIYVPADNPTLTGRMRPVLSRGEVDRLLASVREERLPWVEDRRQRLDAFRDILCRGDERELLLLARCLYQKSRCHDHGSGEAVIENLHGCVANDLENTPQHCAKEPISIVVPFVDDITHDECHECFDEKRWQYPLHISSQQVCQCGTDAPSQRAFFTPQKQYADEYHTVSQMAVTVWSRYFQHINGYKYQCCHNGGFCQFFRSQDIRPFLYVFLYKRIPETGRRNQRMSDHNEKCMDTI